MSVKLPFLPGHRFNDPYKQTFHKNQIFSFTSRTNLGNIQINIRKTKFK